MILTDKQLIEKFNIKFTDKVLDVGGSMKQHKFIHINTLVDILRPEFAPYGKSKLSADNFTQLDVTKQKLPFKDKEFDFCLCTHTLEDLYNPFILIEEMSRVAKRGYISTPSMGKDMEYSNLNINDWKTGPRRVPGIAHHKWFFNLEEGIMKIIPKNYPLLYTSKFHIKKWLGSEEFQYYWEDKIKYEEFKDLNFHELIKIYESFLSKNKKKLKKGLNLIFLDNPYFYLKEFVKYIFNRIRFFLKVPKKNID